MTVQLGGSRSRRAISRGIPPRISAAVAGFRGNSLERNALFIMATTVVNSGLGAIYWLIAARGFSASDVGLATALISLMTIASVVSNFGAGTTLIELLPKRPSGVAWSQTVSAASVVGVLTAVIAGVICVICIPALASNLRPLRHMPLMAVTFVLGVAMWTLSLLVDYVFVAERTAKYMFVRNSAFGLLKIALLLAPVVVGATSALGIFGSWVAGAGISVAIGLTVLVPRLQRGRCLAISGLRREARGMIGSLAGHHTINVAGALTVYALPILVTARLSPASNAYFYTTWMAGGFFLIVSASVGGALFAEGSHSEAEIGGHAVRSLRVIAMLLAPLIVIFTLLGHQILGIFGAAYASHGYPLLVVLLAAAVPDAVTNVYVAVLRVRRNFLQAGLLNAMMSVTTLVLAWVLMPSQGIKGAGYAFLIAQAGGAVAVCASVLARRARVSPAVGDVG